MSAPASMCDRLLAAMRQSAARQYGGERVSELAHALQCADLARAAGADEELALACLLHDVGRYAVDQRTVSDTLEAVADPPPRSRRGHHEVGADLIAPHVSERVAWLVRMHADAKRYLCATEPGYYEQLSAGSKHTLRLQGGVMGPDEVAARGGHPWLEAALALRRWDDQAKVVGKPTRPLEAWEPLLRRQFG
ncbi:MAG: HD domain-containing protein [Candidatus Rokubacteria bacterium]|nr:HD domain-containing protein [Candidatus Rokubacteria bacterium]